MRIYSEFDFDSFQPWSGAVDTYNRIQEEGKGAALEAILDELYPDGMTETELNDLLWFEPETVFEWLGIEDEEEAEDEEEEIDPANYDDFNDFCAGRDCENCPFFSHVLNNKGFDCEAHFEEITA